MSARSSVLVAAAVATLAACGSDPGRDGARSGGGDAHDRLAAAISSALGAKAGIAVATVCPWAVPRCLTRLANGTELVSRIGDGAAAWTWHIDGMLVAAAPLERYVQQELAEMAVVTTASCGPALRRVSPDERIECRLGNGGAAWLTVLADGAMRMELAIDPAAASARSEAMPDTELTRRSHELEHSEDDDAQSNQ